MDREFLGRGVALDFDVDSRGSIKMVSHEQLIRESLFIILSTKIGERVMNHEFGCKIHELMFELNDAFTHAQAKMYIDEAIRRWEPRVMIESIQIDTGAKNELIIDIKYHIIESNVIDNLVYPFYLYDTIDA
ncbi:MAG: GPW/gp25 family protein [Campylobacterales bacterium]|nr:GPW/gp25 family protein [Campylobacterales bacterium]